MVEIGYGKQKPPTTMSKILTKITDKEEWIKRIKTFAWSLLWVGVAAVADHALANLGVLNLPDVNVLGSSVSSAVIVGLVLNQISKFAHNVKNK